MDPGETEDRAAARPEELKRLAGMLEQYDAAVAGLHARLGEAGTAEKGEIEPDLREKLRALGYLE